MFKLINNIHEYRYALAALIRVEIKTSVATTRIGILWWIIDPLLMMLIYYFVISVVFERGGPNYHLFILCGIVSWRFFASALVGSGNSIASNKSLLFQVSIPLPLIVTIQPIVRCFFALFGIVIIIIMSYSKVGLHTLAILPLMFAIIL